MQGPEQLRGVAGRGWSCWLSRGLRRQTKLWAERSLGGRSTLGPSMSQAASGVARVGAAAILLACLAFFVVTTWRWPLVGDASLMHYVAFLMDHGMRPYRDIAEINFPGGFLVDWAVMHSLGGGSLAWRVFDLGLVLVGVGAFGVVARDWFVGVWAGVVFGLVHGRDGIFDLGQRDFVVAVLVLVGFAGLLRAARGGWDKWLVLFGLCAGCAGAIKPTYLFLGPVVLGFLAVLGWRRRRFGAVSGGVSQAQLLIYGGISWLVPLLAVGIWLWRMGSLIDFVRVGRTLMAYHAGLARRPVGFLLLHSVAPVLPLLILWILVVAVFERERRRDGHAGPSRPTQANCGLEWGTRASWERTALMVGIVVGLFSYVIQGKGYPYQRYPLLALLLVTMGMDFAAAARRAGLARLVGWVGIAYGVLFLAPSSAWAASRYDWRNLEFQDALVEDLDRLGGERLSGEVQCIDTVGGCYGALYRARIVSSSGFLYDEFLFGAERDGVIAESRRRFWVAFEARPPRVVIVVDGLFPSGPPGFGKLALWPEFDAALERDYLVFDQVRPSDPVFWWARKDEPRSFRIYVRR